jgi:hypothetical protein
MNNKVSRMQLRRWMMLVGVLLRDATVWQTWKRQKTPAVASTVNSSFVLIAEVAHIRSKGVL